MKLLLTTIALAIAVPAAAQTGAPTQSPAQSTPHSDHAMPGMTQGDHDDRCEMKSSDGKAMECCEKMEAGHKAADSHAGHNMDSH